MHVPCASVCARSQRLSSQRSTEERRAETGQAMERLSLRAQRPRRELVQDSAQRALINEITVLETTARLMQGSTMRLEGDQARLAAIQARLADTLELKSHFLEIERAGEPAMAVLQEAVASVAAEIMPPVIAYRAALARPGSALPANRLSLSRISSRA